MKLSRGDIVTAAFQGDLKKPRPAVVLQANEFMDGHLTVLTWPFTSHLTDAPLVRPTIEPSAENGLLARSQVMVDKTTPARKDALGQVIGRLSEEDMRSVEAALINITGLRHSLLPLFALREHQEK